MSLNRKMHQRVARRAARVRAKIVGTEIKPRVSVFRSLNNIYAQVIDDQKSLTMASFSSLQLEKTVVGKKSEKAFSVGKELAKIAVEKGIKKIVFDRGSFLYHGRVKALADGLREGGLLF